MREKLIKTVVICVAVYFLSFGLTTIGVKYFSGEFNITTALILIAIAILISLSIIVLSISDEEKFYKEEKIIKK